MEIATNCPSKPINLIKSVTNPTGTFSVLSKSKKSTVIEFFDDLYISPPRFRIKWNSVDELHEDLFMSHNYRNLEHDLPFLDILSDYYSNNEENQSRNSVSSSRSYVKGYFNKIISTRFYGKQTTKIQNSLKNVPIYVILNGQGNIILTNSTDQSNASTKNINTVLYKFCGSFDPITEDTSQLGLFFMSRKDAEIYLQEIARSDPKGTKMFGLSVHCFGLDFAYRMLREYNPDSDFRIIPDFTEMQKLLTKNVGKSDLIFEEGQQQLRLRNGTVKFSPERFSKTIGKWAFHFPHCYSNLVKTEYFKGVPIYIVRVNDLQRNFVLERYQSVINFLCSGPGKAAQYLDFLLGFGNGHIRQGSLNEKKYSDKSTTYIFFEQEVASQFCRDFKRKIEPYKDNHSSIFTNLISKPKIFVYNLEDFLESWEDHLIMKTKGTKENKRSK